ncbi:elavl2 [Symbiodinium sp. CCMP2592]|nr:elavl2 [Symbiodinium sp. CCMP2592]
MASLPGGRPGTVKAWIEERGMGFIAPADGSPDVFVHRSNLTDGNALVIGSEVFFEPGWDDSKSKPIAAKCSGATTLNGGALIRRAPGPGPPLANGQPGTVKAWLDDRGMGFISPADGGADVFVHRSNLMDGNCLSVGAQVMFEAGWDESKAKPIAKAVSGAAMAPTMSGKGCWGSPSIPNGQHGVVKAWIDARGMGFITPADGSADVFVHRSNLIDGDALIVGAPVVFEAGFDPQKGKPIAKVCAGATQGAAMGFGGPAAGKGGQGHANGLEPLTGVMKVWFADKGFGFITLDNGMGDAFVGSSAIPAGMVPHDGMPVVFTASWNPEKQKFTAMEILPDAKGKGKGSSGASASGELPCDNCFVTGLPLDMNEEKLQSLFGTYGNVVSCKVLPGEGRPDRAALVRFATVDEAAWVVENVSGTRPPGLETPVSVRYAASKSHGSSSPIFQGPGKGGCGLGGGGEYGRVVPPPVSQVQAAQIGTVKAAMGNSLVVIPADGGPDLHVPMSALLDGNPEVGGLVSFSAQEGRGGKGFGKAPAVPAGMSQRYSPYGATAPPHGQAGGFAKATGTGTVKAWMENRGMGFIAPNDGSQDLFVHRSYLADGGALVVGSPVTFTAEYDVQKGKAIAVNVFGAVPQPMQST